ncbi:MAG: ketopantoate reductase family protein [Lentisphaeria bacterium]|nr:ketopantoate reductase family protein [Lentisphaeria bacterium]
MKNIILLGAGAVGVLLAEKLCRLPGINFAAAADACRVERYRRDGIFFNGEKLPLTFISPADDFPEADLIIAATKTTSLPRALEVITPFSGRHTVFLPFLNGITAAEVIKNSFPENEVAEGFFVGHASVRDGNRITHDGCGTFCIGGNIPHLRNIETLLKNAGINVDIPEDMAHAVWKKFVLNIGINQTQAVFNADYGTVQKSESMLDFCKELMIEALAVAEAENIRGTETMLKYAMDIILSMPGNVKTSMLQDIQNNRVTEVDAFAGTICAKAAEYGIPVPRNKEVLSVIKGKKLS